MLYIKLFIEREKNIGQSAPECAFKGLIIYCNAAISFDFYGFVVGDMTDILHV